MKTCTAIAASALVAMVSIDSAMGMASYLDQLPNGSTFTKQLGHTDSGYTDFGTAFSKVGAKWSAEFCKTTFPGSTMTVGAAFGDPCCTWKVGSKADFPVTAFTTSPTTETKCASAATPSEAPAATTAAPSSGSSSSSPAPTNATPTVTTAAPSSGSSSGSKTSAPASTPAPAPSGKTPAAGGKKPSKCGVKKESKSLDDGEDEDDTDSNDN